MAAGDEVSGLMVRMVLDGCRRRGVDVRPLILGLPFGPDPGRERYAWDDFVVFEERAAAALGGPWKMAAFLRDEVALDRRLQVIAGLFVAPRLLFLYLPERMASRMFWNLGTRIDELPDGRIRWEIRIPDRYRSAPSFFVGSVGTAEGLPRLVGHPPAQVDAELSDRHAVYLIRPPSSRTIGGRIARFRAPPVADPELLAEALEMGLGHSFLAELSGRLGRTLVEATDEGALLAALAAELRERFLARYLALVSPSGDARVLVRKEPVPATTAVRELRVGERNLGRLEIDVPEAGEHGALLDALVPWIALALDRVGRRTDGVEGRLGAAIEAWRLTPRQAQALEGIVRGRTNKQIAEALGTTVKTVELHVGLLLKKTGCDGRACLVSRFFRDLPAVSGREATVEPPPPRRS
jgi:DNA-binding CsgD family transcriptional regulator